MITCPNCSAAVFSGATDCPRCGHLFASSSLESASPPLPLWLRMALWAAAAAVWQVFASTVLFWLFPYSLLATALVGHLLAGVLIKAAIWHLIACLLAPLAVFLGFAVSAAAQPVEQLAVRLAAAQLSVIVASALASFYWRKAN